MTIVFPPGEAANIFFDFCYSYNNFDLESDKKLFSYVELTKKIITDIESTNNSIFCFVPIVQMEFESSNSNNNLSSDHNSNLNRVSSTLKLDKKELTTEKPLVNAKNIIHYNIYDPGPHIICL